MSVKLTKSQVKALEALKQGKNCFITGDAGTGKTYLINHFLKEYCGNKSVLRCAYTALAADHMDGGRTLHSAFMISDYPTVKDKSWSSGQDLSKYDILIIDEISMVRIDYFEGFIKTINRASAKRKMFGFKPIQIILCGDFFQLPPIATDAEKRVLGEIYGVDKDGVPKIYPFESEYWNENNIKYIHLHEIVRQSDKKFVDMLNNVKLTKDVDKTLSTLKTLTAKKQNDRAINLFASNKKVNKWNKTMLDQIDSESVKFEAKFNEDFKKALKSGDLKESDIPVEKVLYLKPGARVMFTKNDQYKKNGERQFQNGSLGTIKEITDKEITVILDEDDLEVSIPLEHDLPEEEKKYSWSLYDDPICRDKKTVIQNPNPKVAWQVPLKLAYAITIHKSQGQTYEYANFDPKEDELQLQEGQLYVLLSRLTDIKGLYLMNDIKVDQCKTSLKVIRFYKNQKGE